MPAVKLLIDRYKVNVQETGRHGRNAFYAASLGGKLDTMEYLGDNFPEIVNVKDSYGFTTLTLTSRFGSLSAVRLLIDRFQVDVYEPGYQDRNAFHEAILSGETDKMVYIGDNFPDIINARSREKHNTGTIIC